MRERRGDGSKETLGGTEFYRGLGSIRSDVVAYGSVMCRGRVVLGLCRWGASRGGLPGPVRHCHAAWGLAARRAGVPARPGLRKRRRVFASVLGPTIPTQCGP